MSDRCTGILLRALLTVGGALGASSLQAGIEIIAANGEPSPTGNGTLSLFNAPTLNANGQAAFVAQLAGTSGGTTDHLALYRKDAVGLTQIVRTGSTNVNGLPMTGFFPASSWIAASGLVTSIVGAGPPPAQIHNVLGDGGTITLQYPPGSPHPQGNGTLFGVQTSTQNDAGVAVFSAIYTGGTPETGLYRRTVDGTFSTVLPRNATAPRGGTFTTVGRGTINEAGQIASNSTVNSSLSSALRISGSTVLELARQGDIAADGVTTLGGIFSSALAINDIGQVAFDAQYTQPQIQRRGVFVADDSGLRLITPGLLPGMASTVNDARVLGITVDGEVGFWAEASGGIDPTSGMYVADSSGPTLVAAEDTLIPSGGKYFRRFFTDAMSYNDNGQLAFLAELSDAANGAASGRGLFTYDREQGLTEVVKVGDALAGGTVSSVLFYGSIGSVSLQAPDLSLSGLNNLGQVGFGYALANNAGAGVAIWSPDVAFAEGDFDRDGHVDGDDLAAWALGFSTTESAEHEDGDADGDGDVDGADFLKWQQQLSGESALAAVPEPPAAPLLTLAATASFLLRRPTLSRVPTTRWHERRVKN
jgi:hypothetical protein